MTQPEQFDDDTEPTDPESLKNVRRINTLLLAIQKDGIKSRIGQHNLSQLRAIIPELDTNAKEYVESRIKELESLNHNSQKYLAFLGDS